MFALRQGRTDVRVAIWGQTKPSGPGDAATASAQPSTDWLTDLRPAGGWRRLSGGWGGDLVGAGFDYVAYVVVDAPLAASGVPEAAAGEAF